MNIMPITPVTNQKQSQPTFNARLLNTPNSRAALMKLMGRLDEEGARIFAGALTRSDNLASQILKITAKDGVHPDVELVVENGDVLARATSKHLDDFTPTPVKIAPNVDPQTGSDSQATSVFAALRDAIKETCAPVLDRLNVKESMDTRRADAILRFFESSN